MELGKKIMIFSTVAILATGGYQLVKNSNPYNNKQISFINKELKDFSPQMEDFIENDFKDFDRIMRNLSNGRYDACTTGDVDTLDQYINTLLTCNFSTYEPKYLVDRQKSGFVVNFENYFDKGSEEYRVIQWASEQYQNIIEKTYKLSNPSFGQMVEKCGLEYNIHYKDSVNRINPFARYLVLKLIRPILDLENYNDVVYEIKGKTLYQVYLGNIDGEIERCFKQIKNNCKDIYGHRY